MKAKAKSKNGKSVTVSAYRLTGFPVHLPVSSDPSAAAICSAIVRFRITPLCARSK